MASSRLGRAAAATGVGAAAMLGYQLARYKRATAERLRMVEPPAPGSAEFSDLVEALAGAPLRPGTT